MLSYCYFTADTNNAESNRNIINWHGTCEPMKRNISRKCCMGKNMMKLDECHVREDSKGFSECCDEEMRRCSERKGSERRCEERRETERRGEDMIDGRREERERTMKGR